MSSQDDGFPRADISTSWLDDPKVRKLSKRLLDDEKLAVTLMVYQQTVLASWREGRRLSINKAEAWFEATPERVKLLQEVALLDDQGRVPEHAWKRHFGPAWRRREGLRAGGRSRADQLRGTDSLAGAQLEPSYSLAGAPLSREDEFNQSTRQPGNQTGRPTNKQPM